MGNPLPSHPPVTKILKRDGELFQAAKPSDSILDLVSRPFISSILDSMLVHGNFKGPPGQAQVFADPLPTHSMANPLADFLHQVLRESVRSALRPSQPNSVSFMQNVVQLSPSEKWKG